METPHIEGPDYYEVQSPEPKMGKQGPTAIADIEDCHPELALTLLEELTAPSTYHAHTEHE